MADEYIDILEKSGESTGRVALKSEAHRLGLYHASVHIWVFTEDGQILLQKRADDKDTYPGLWDVSVAGHIGAGESPKVAAIREIKEEIGLTIAQQDLNFITIYLSEKIPQKGLFDNEFHHIFLSLLTTPIDQLSLQKEEVSSVKLIRLPDFINQLDNEILSKKYVPHDRAYYDLIIDEIHHRL